ncbi:MAG: beta-lactamase family protein [Saprospiraceae bacterium]|nr:beta-lactamase family protein [Saprospiraceae bacterium]
MKNLMILFWVTFVIPFHLLAQDNHYAEAIRIMDIWLEAQRNYDNLPGISVALIKDQKMIWGNGYGFSDLENKTPVTASTKFSICSISKLFTSIAIMQLFESGKLRLDDQIEDLLPWYDLKQQFAGSGPITIRSLLTHSSGLPRESAHPYWTGPAFDFPSPEEVRTGLQDQETLYPASTYFQYSNLAMTLLGEVVAHVSGMPYGDYIRSRILQPLEMHDTETYLPVAEWGGQLAIGYSAEDRSRNRVKLNLFDAEGIAAAAGFSSTVEDLGKFAAWQFRLLSGGDVEILKASTLRYMQQVHWMDPDWKTSWGLGFAIWEQEGKSMVGHGGSCPGYRSTIVIDPTRKLAAIAMINAQAVNPSKYTKGMLALVIKAEGKETSHDTMHLEQYAGFYNSQPWWPEEVIVPWQGKLASIALPNENPATEMSLLKQLEGHHFRRVRDDDTLGEEIRFELDQNGRIIKYWQHNNFTIRVADFQK